MLVYRHPEPFFKADRRLEAYQVLGQVDIRDVSPDFGEPVRFLEYPPFNPPVFNGFDWRRSRQNITSRVKCYSSEKFFSSLIPNLCDFSGWNCVP